MLAETPVDRERYVETTPSTTWKFVGSCGMIVTGCGPFVGHADVTVLVPVAEETSPCAHAEYTG
jgi:hypothetical protein